MRPREPGNKGGAAGWMTDSEVGDSGGEPGLTHCLSRQASDWLQAVTRGQVTEHG